MNNKNNKNEFRKLTDILLKIRRIYTKEPLKGKTELDNGKEQKPKQSKTTTKETKRQKNLSCEGQA